LIHPLTTLRRRFTIATFVAGVVYLVVLALMVYGVERYQTGPLLVGYGLLFGLYLMLFWGAKELPFWSYLLLAAVARLLLLPSVPSLSDDFYRFLWDGHLLVGGLHPFSHTPEWYMQAGVPAVENLSQELYHGLNSKSYFTVYPPLAQALFAFAAWLGGSNILAGIMLLRLPLLLAECGTVWLLLKLLKLYGLPQRRVLLYALNPLVVLEITCNLHLEGLAIFFLLLLVWSLGKIEKGRLSGENIKPFWTAVAFAGAVASKLWPLLLGPFLLLKLGGNKRWQWLLISAGIVFVLFVPLFGKPLLEGMLQSISLYYQRFEFNASLYYLLRELGYWIFGFNLIVQLGPVLAVLAAGLILYFSNRSVKRGWSTSKTLLLLYGLFLLCATTVHPWYVIPLLALMPLTQFRFPLIWSACIFLTYAGYTQTGYEEPMLFVALEYVVVILMLWWELKHQKLQHENTDRGTGSPLSKEAEIIVGMEDGEIKPSAAGAPIKS
jgi:alpha-1,6-mannosyltransferase